MFLRNLSLKKKLIGGFGLIALVTMFGAAFSMVEIRGLTAFVARAAAIHELTKLGTLASEMIGLERAIVLYSIFDDKKSVEQYKARLEDASKAFGHSLDSISAGAVSPEVGNTIAALRNKYSAWLALHAEIVAALDKQQVDVAQKKVADPAFIAAVDDMRRLSNDMSEREALSIRKEASTTEGTASISFVVLAIVTLTAGAFVLLYIRRLTNTLCSLTDSLAGNSEQVNKLSIGVHSASESLARGSATQATSLQETAASTDEITAMTRQNASNSQSAAEVMAEMDRHIKDCNRTLESTLASMEEINSSSNKISKIIRVIDEIAFQTNILALNAAVEAARAGDAGLGFAVVADEVRNLAQRSAQAAKDTTAMIEESIAKSNGGSTELQQLTEMIREITASASKVKTLVDSVSSGSQEQARGIDQISQAVSKMDQLTHSTASSAQESASASDKLSAQAAALNEVVFELRTLVEGGSHKTA